MKSCQEITYLASNLADRPMTTGEKIEFHVHLMICGHCRRFYQNNQRLSKILHAQNKQPLSSLSYQKFPPSNKQSP